MSKAAGDAISAYFARTEKMPSEEERMRERYRHAMRILRKIPSGTPDSELTPEQRNAWREHDEAMEWFESSAVER